MIVTKTQLLYKFINLFTISQKSPVWKYKRTMKARAQSNNLLIFQYLDRVQKLKVAEHYISECPMYLSNAETSSAC